MLDMSSVVNDLDFAQPFSVIRASGGAFVAGIWTQTPTTIPSYGVISVASAEDLLQVPEGDRVTGTMVFHSSAPIYRTSLEREATSDILIWREQKYRVSQVFPYMDFGYVKAFAVRMSGA